MAQGIKEQIGTLATVEAEAHLIQIGLQVLCANAMPCSNDAPFKKRERGFYRVGVNVSSKPHVLFCTMVDRLVLCIADSLTIGAPFVGDDYVYILRDVFLNVSRQRSRLGIFSVKEANGTTALANADYGLFVTVSESSLTVAALIAADIGFVHLDSAVQQWPITFAHGGTDAMAEIPCGFVAHAQHALYLIRAHTLAGFTDQVSSNEPLQQRQMGIVEDGSSGNTELIIAVFAVKQLRGESRQRARLAAWAFRAKRPAQPFQKFAAAVVRIKCSSYIKERHV